MMYLERDNPTNTRQYDIVGRDPTSSEWITKVFEEDEASQEVPTLIRKYAIGVMRNHFDGTMDPDIRRLISGKVPHTREVVEANSQIMSQTTNVPWNKPQGATIAMLHDIGRIPQAYYRTFSEKVSGFDHATQGMRMVEQAGLFFDLPIDDSTVLHAIDKHSRFAAESDDPYALLIRDADKLALIRYYAAQTVEHNPETRPDSLTPEVRQSFLNGHQVINGEIQTEVDTKVRTAAWVFDVNFDVTKQMIAQEQLLHRLLRQIQELTGEYDPEIVARINEWEAGVKAS